MIDVPHFLLNCSFRGVASAHHCPFRSLIVRRQKWMFRPDRPSTSEGEVLIPQWSQSPLKLSSHVVHCPPVISASPWRLVCAQGWSECPRLCDKQKQLKHRGSIPRMASHKGPRPQRSGQHPHWRVVSIQCTSSSDFWSSWFRFWSFRYRIIWVSAKVWPAHTRTTLQWLWTRVSWRSMTGSHMLEIRSRKLHPTLSPNCSSSTFVTQSTRHSTIRLKLRDDSLSIRQLRALKDQRSPKSSNR